MYVYVHMFFHIWVLQFCIDYTCRHRISIWDCSYHALWFMCICMETFNTTAWLVSWRNAIVLMQDVFLQFLWLSSWSMRITVGYWMVDNCQPSLTINRYRQQSLRDYQPPSLVGYWYFVSARIRYHSPFSYSGAAPGVQSLPRKKFGLFECGA